MISVPGEGDVILKYMLGRLKRTRDQQRHTDKENWAHRLAGTLLSTMMPSVSSWVWVNRYGPRTCRWEVTTPTLVELPLPLLIIWEILPGERATTNVNVKKGQNYTD
jgi:hypothetical protein